MALCPKCNHILNFWNVKAECPHCGVNIPNYNWERRLDEDARNAEIAWAKFRKFTGNFKSALFGSKIRIIRFVCTFLPLIILILPLANYTLTIPFTGGISTDFTLVDFTLNTLFSLNWGSILPLVASENIGVSVLLLLLSVVLLYSAVIFGVLNFLFILLKAPSLRAVSNIVLCSSSLVSFAAAGILFTVAVSQIGSTTAVFLNGSVQFGFLIGIALFALNVVLNTVINKGFKKQREQA